MYKNTMSIKKTHYMILSILVNDCLKNNPCVYDTYQEQNLTNERFNWDIFWHVTRKKPDFKKSLFSYLKDDNINTALKNITKKL